MKLTPYQQWLNGLMIDDRLDPMELAWIAAMEWAKKELDDSGHLTPEVSAVLRRGME